MRISVLHKPCMFSFGNPSNIGYGLKDNHTLFLIHIAHDKYEARKIRPKTVKVLLEEIMKTAEIVKTRLKAHTLGFTSRTEATMAFVPIDDIKLHSNWRLINSIFENYHHKPGY